MLTWRRQWQPTPVLLPGKSHGRRDLVGCSPWGREESDTTERLHFIFHFHFSLSCIGEGNGNPLQYSCLENPRDRGAWWLPSMGSHRVGHDWSDLAVAAAYFIVCNHSSYISIPAWYSILWMYHNLCIHYIIYRHLNCFQFGAIMNDAVMSIHENVFWWHIYVLLALIAHICTIIALICALIAHICSIE